MRPTICSARVCALGAADPGEKKVYFEVGGYSSYVFFENPH